MTEPKLQAPQINLNGSSKNVLIEQLLDVKRAGRALLEAMASATPHGRDYQTLAPEAYQLARAQHEARTKRVLELMDEIEELARGVYAQGK